jgi:hypothetical protein
LAQKKEKIQSCSIYKILFSTLEITMKKLIYLIACIALTAISCGVVADLPTVQPTEAVGHVTETLVTTNVETVNKDETYLQYTVTAPLHIRSCASITCSITGYLQTGDSVDVKWSVAGPGCAGAPWNAIALGDWTGFVCSLYVEAK